MKVNKEVHSSPGHGQKILAIFKILALMLLGGYVGLTIYRSPQYLREYSQRGLPPEWQGPKYMHWRNGVRIA